MTLREDVERLAQIKNKSDMEWEWYFDELFDDACYKYSPGDEGDDWDQFVIHPAYNKWYKKEIVPILEKNGPRAKAVFEKWQKKLFAKAEKLRKESKEVSAFIKKRAEMYDGKIK